MYLFFARHTGAKCGTCSRCRRCAVVRGRWEYIPQTLNTLSQLRCPFCRWWSLDPSIDGAYNYCPNCGARMDGDDDAKES